MSGVNFYIGVDSFREIREKERYYVDKTGLIEEFLNSSYPQISLITRPRRFGKTLTMTMLREFFNIKAENKKLFEGLAISKNQELCRKWQNQYPVIYLTLKDSHEGNTLDAFRQFSMILQKIFQQHRYILEDDKVYAEDKENFQLILNASEDKKIMTNALDILSRVLYSYHKKKVILLIDEYDVPINNAYHRGFYEEMIEFMRKFLGSALKGNEYLEFAVLTGCLRIAKESIFTGLNNFKCFGISDNQFSTAIGFTSEEVDKILADAGLEEKKGLIKEWYEGYHFGKNSEIYCPWDVSNYIVDLQSEPELSPKLYWNRTSGNDIIKDFLCRTDFNIKSKFEAIMQGGCVEIRLSEQQAYNILHCSEENFWNILYAAGYLTKANGTQCMEYGKSPEEGKCLLVIPNKEVLEIYKDAIQEWFSQVVIPSKKKRVITAFWQGKADIVSTLFSDILMESISCRDYSESFYHGILVGIFAGSEYTVLSNRESGLGYYDLLITYNSALCALIEIKRAEFLKNLEEEAVHALSQIEEKKYAEVTEGFKNVLHWGMAFYQKRCFAAVKK